MSTFSFTLEDLSNPQGKNGLSSFSAYYQRLLYKNEIYPPYLVAPLDTWYDKQYYGRVDRVQNTILPDPSKFKAITSAVTPNFFALNFVVDAFEGLVNHMKRAQITGVCVADGNKAITEMTAHRAFEDPMTIYRSFLNTVFESFDTKTPRFTDKITDFGSFIAEFIPHLKVVDDYIPITLSNYLLTGTIGFFSSALCIAIDTGPFDDDDYKYENFINDPNFTFYVGAAKKFGFTVNKNSPWVLTADLFSDAALKYITQYTDSENNPINENTFFDEYYTKTYLQDIFLLRLYIVNSYNSYVDRNPYYEKRIYKAKCAKFSVENSPLFSTGVDNSLRVPLTGDVAEVLTPKMLADLYLYLRSNEAQNPLQLTKKLMTELNSIYNLKPDENLSAMDNVAQYINLIYRDYIYSAKYLLLNTNLAKNLKTLDNQIRTGKIATVGSITQQLY